MNIKYFVSKYYVSFFVFLLSLIAIPVANAAPLWYNGDPSYGIGFGNMKDMSYSVVYVYDDFIVGPDGWVVNSVYSNNYIINSAISQAYWEIRSGVSQGNGGTLLFSGTSLATQTQTAGAFGSSTYTIRVSGLNIPLSEGTYWLMVAPIGHDGSSEISYLVASHYYGVNDGNHPSNNAIGNPPGNDDRSFFYRPDISIYNYIPATDVISGNYTSLDFSMGINGESGNLVPEPASLALFGIGGIIAAFFRKK